MELTFQEKTIPCLRRVVSQLLRQEQTQEIRLADSQPDVGRVIGVWGQPLIRGKEWRNGSMSVSGGVSAWVLYEPEGDAPLQSLQAWIPFQFKWELPETKRDGNILAAPYVMAMDARATSGRKLILRCEMGLMGEALEPVEPVSYIPDEVPEDVQLLHQTYPMVLPVEAGEKLFQLEEKLTLPPDKNPVSKVLRVQLTPQILEKKVLAGRLVFRGQGDVHVLYADEKGRIHSWDVAIPFSHFAELDREYTQAANAWIQPVVTALELDVGESPVLRAGVAAQYVISDGVMTELVEDAYSPRREVSLELSELSLPMLLSAGGEEVQISGSKQAPAGKVMDAAFQPFYPELQQEGDFLQVTVPGTMSILWEDPEGKLCTVSEPVRESYRMLSDPGNKVGGFVLQPATPECRITDSGIAYSVTVGVDSNVFGGQGLPMVRAMELGEAKEPDPTRPSLIMRRMGSDRLWDIAKSCGSTVEAIRKANMIKQEPTVDQMLLIPVS